MVVAVDSSSSGSESTNSAVVVVVVRLRLDRLLVDGNRSGKLAMIDCLFSGRRRGEQRFSLAICSDDVCSDFSAMTFSGVGFSF